MNTKILAQNIVNNPSDFTAAQIEKYFEDYAELRLSAVSKRYFIIRRYNCGTSVDTTDILGLTTDEEYAKSRESVFCGYEEVKMIP